MTATDCAVTPGHVDVLGDPLAQLGVAEVGHVPEPPRPDRRGRPLEGLAHRLGGLEGLAEREVGDRVGAVALSQPLGGRRTGAHPAPRLDLPAHPHGDGAVAGRTALSGRTATARLAGLTALDPDRRVPPSCQENG